MTRRPSEREPASSTSSGSPRRTFTERCEPRRAVASATSAPAFFARSTTRADAASSSSIPSIRSPTDLCAADGHRGDLHGRTADAHRHALPILAAGPDPVGGLEVVAEHDDLAHHVGAVADEVHALERRRDLAVLDEVALRQRKDEVAVSDVDLSAAKLRGVDAALDAA